MRILLLANNRVGWQVADLLHRQQAEVVGVVIHPDGRRKHAEQILDAVGLPATRVFDGGTLREPDVLAAIRALRPDIGLSIFFGHILREAFTSIFPSGVINLHPAYLPYNRGQFPNVWSIVEGTPAGVTLHYIDGGIDTGDIIARREVPVDAVDTGRSLYLKLEEAAFALFAETWPSIRRGDAPRQPQARDEGTFHRTRDVETIDQIDLDGHYSGRTLIDILRARTFPPHAGAYFIVDGRKVFVRIELQYEDLHG